MPKNISPIPTSGMKNNYLTYWSNKMSEEKKLYDPGENEPLPEGEEAPPPLTHAMSIVRWVLLIGLSLFAAFMILHYLGVASPLSANTEKVTQYHCPMHPTYISNQPGECPICGMTLVPIDSKSKTKLISKSTDKKGNPAVSDTPKSDNVTTKAIADLYACPMHPEVISDKTGKCPKCGMDLIKTTASIEAASKKNSDPEGSDDMQGMPGMEKTSPETISTVTAPQGLVPVTIEPDRLQLIGIKTGFVKRGSLDNKIHIVGFVTPDETRLKNVTIRVSGWVLDLFVDKTGQFVKAGQPLLSIYSQDLYQAEQDFMVARDAVKNDSTAGGPVLVMRHQMLDAARERLKLMGLSEQELAEIEKSDIPSTQMVLRSPFSGYVLDKSALPGQYLSPSQSLFTIADLSNIWVLGDVYEQDIASIHEGQTAHMKLTALPGEEFEGKISFIYPSVSQQTRTLKVRLEFANPSMKILPGMYAEVDVEHGGAPTLIVPSEAVLDGGQTQYAFVAHNNNHFEPRLLKLGHTSDDWDEVLSGLKEGEEVVISANFLIDSESRLKAAVAGMGSMPGMEGMPDMQKQSGKNSEELKAHAQ
jgi:Cu(I)/Ag(I) efflux system membrane fusion protein